jgi:hypothetical protein
MSRRATPGRDDLLDAGMRLYPDRLDVVLLGRLEVGMAEEVRRDAYLLGRAVDQLGHGAIPEQMRPDRLPEGILGSGFDLMPDRTAAHGPSVAIEPEVASDTGLDLPRCN